MTLPVSTALDLFTHTRHQVERFFAPLPDARLAEQPAGIRNHPAWTLGHLCGGHDLALQLLGQSSGIDPAWLTLMGNDSLPVAERAAYPSKAALLAQYGKGHAMLCEGVKQAPASAWTAVMPIEAYRGFFPTVGHALAYFLLTHDDAHLSQLLPWRRAAGLAG